MKWGDYSQEVTGAQLADALVAGGFEGVLHYMAGTSGFVLRVELPAVVQEIAARGFPQMGIDTPTLGAVNGPATAQRVRGVYGKGPGFVVWLDIEPDQFRINPDAWVAKADAWCDAIRAAGLVPGVYGTDVTVAACANRADRIWRAKPDMCDPAGPGLDSAFFAGRRMVQCSVEVAGGVEFDVSFSQWEGSMSLSQGFKVGLAHIAVFAIYQRDPTQAEMFDFADTINDDGSNLADLVQQLADNTAHPDGVRLRNTVLADEVDTLKGAAAPAMVNHHHDGGPTGPAVAD